MSLFQTSVLQKHLNLLDNISVEKAYKKYTKHFFNPTIQENIKNSKEEEYQGLFITEQQKAQKLQTQITLTDNEIDQMVYELYGLTDEEIAIVENS